MKHRVYEKAVALLAGAAMSIVGAIGVVAPAQAASTVYCYGESTEWYAITYVVGCKSRHLISGQYRGNPNETYSSMGPWALWGVQSNASRAEIVLVTSHSGIYVPVG